MFGIFWMAFAYGVCAGLLFWCNEMYVKGWRRNAVQPIPQ